MKKIIRKIGAALQVVLMAPIKLPGKVLNIIKYVALGLGVVETVLEDKDNTEQEKQAHDLEKALDHKVVKSLDAASDESSDAVNKERRIPNESE